MSYSKDQYYLDIKIPKQIAQRLKVKESFSIGADPRNDVILSDMSAAPIVFKMSIQDNTLTLLYIAETGDAVMDEFPLEKQKHYILDHEDIIHYKGARLTIHKNEAPPLEEKDVFTKKLNQKKEIRVPEKYQSPEIEGEEISELREINQILNSQTSEEEKHPNKKPIAKPEKKNSISKLNKFRESIGLNYQIYGQVVDMAFGMLVLQTLIPFFGIQNDYEAFWQPVRETIWPTLPSQVAPFSHIIEIYLVFQFINLILNFIFGLNFYQILFGIRTRDSFIISRFKAIFRSFLQIFTLPTILFEFPITLKFKSFKDILTFTDFEYRSGSPNKLGTFILAPLIMVASLSTSLWYKEFYLIPNVQFQIYKPKISNEVFPQSFHLSTNNQSLSLSLDLEIRNEVSILPSSVDAITFFNSVSDDKFEIKKLKSWQKDEVLQMLNFIKPDRVNHLDSTLSVANELEQLLNFEPVTLAKILYDQGPFLAGKFYFLKEFITFFPMSLENPQKMEFPDMVFWPSVDKKAQIMTLARFGQNQIAIYTIHFKGESREITNYLYSQLIPALKEYNQVNSSAVTNFDAFAILEQLKLRINEKSWPQVYSFYFQHAKTWIENDNQKGLDELKTSLMFLKSHLQNPKNISPAVRERTFSDIEKLKNAIEMKQLDSEI